MKRADFMNKLFKAYCKEVPYHDDGGLQAMWRVQNIVNVIDEFMVPPLIKNPRVDCKTPFEYADEKVKAEMYNYDFKYADEPYEVHEWEDKDET